MQFIGRRLFIYRWQKARKQASIGNDLRAIELLARLDPPDKYRSILLAQKADSLFRLNRLGEADELYLEAIGVESSFSMRKNPENRRYILAYCKYHRNAIQKAKGLEDPNYRESEQTTALYDDSVSKDLRNYLLPRPDVG